MKSERFTSISLHTSGPAVLLTLAVLIGLFTGHGCNAATVESQQSPPEHIALPDFVADVIERASGITYITEQDSEVFAFYRNTPVGELTGATFVALLRRPPETKIVEQSWASFFDARTRTDSTGRWTSLRKYLQAHLTNPTVFRLPREAPYHAQYDLYAVGILNGTTVVGIQMFGVAT